MIASTLVYAGVIALVAGVAFAIKPIAALRVRTRRRGLAIAAAGAAVALGALFAPAFESRVPSRAMRLDEFARVWQFHEVHSLRVAAPPDRVYDAIKQVRADEIWLFRTLTWIRRGGRTAPPSILNAGADRSIIEVATKGGFVLLADDPPRELVLGTIVAAPTGPRSPLTAAMFREPVPDGFALATMNFLVTPDGMGGSIVSTETRVAAAGPARRTFAAYWRVIYPGSSLLRRTWLRAIARRANRAGRPIASRARQAPRRR
jgi:hypothetical protein